MTNSEVNSRPAFLNESLPVLYTVPPSSEESGIPEYLERLESVFSNSKIHAISAPELIQRTDEQGDLKYTRTGMAPEDFLSHFPAKQERITTFIAPRIPKEEFPNRVEHIKDQGIQTAILVGPERSQDIEVLGGYTLAEGMKQASQNGLAVGGITIPWRENPDPAYKHTSKFLEYERMAYKQQHGCQFVTSQLLFESFSPSHLIKHYGSHCKENNIEPMTIFFSFCVVPSKKTLDFLYELDVDIPARQRRHLLHSEDLTKESIQMACDLWGHLQDVRSSEAPTIPFGLQIEQITSKRVDTSLELLDALLAV